MQKQAVINQLKNILVEDLFIGDSVDEIKETDELGTDLGLDSVGFVELGTIVSEGFNISVQDTDIAQGHFATLQKLSEFILQSIKCEENACRKNVLR